LEKLAGVLEASSHVTSKASHYMHSVDPPMRQPPEHQPHHNKFFFTPSSADQTSWWELNPYVGGKEAKTPIPQANQ